MLKYNSLCVSLSLGLGCMDLVEWNGGMDWTGLDWNGMEWNDQMICGRDRPLTL